MSPGWESMVISRRRFYLEPGVICASEGQIGPSSARRSGRSEPMAW